MKKLLVFAALCLLTVQPALAQTKNYKLFIHPQPKDAKITLWNIKPAFKQGMSLPEGRYHIQVVREGYAPYLEWVTLKGKDLQLNIELKAKPARLFIEPTPAEAKITLWNIVAPYAPGMVLAPGRYDLQVSAPGYKTYREWIEIKPGDTRLPVLLHGESAGPVPRATAAPAASGQYGLHVYPDPPDARVMIMNIVPAFTQGIRLAPGKYHLQVSKSGHPTRSQWVELGQEDLTVKVHLSPAPQCFSAKETEAGSDVSARWLKLVFHDNYVAADYILSMKAGKTTNQFHLIGVRQGNHLDLIGSAYYGDKPIELRSGMTLKGDKLVVDFDGEVRTLNKLACQ